MKLYIITIEDVYDGVSEHTSPIVKTSIEEARQELDNLWSKANQLYPDQFDIYEKSDNCFEMYEEGYYCQNHYGAVIDEVEIEL
jgi:regulator of replication initiation timing